MLTITWRTTALLVAVVCGSIGAKAANEAPPFYWIVTNNNRVVAGDERQDRYEKELCRALDCSESARAWSTFPFCHATFNSSKYNVAETIALRGKFCDTARYSDGRRTRYWLPFPDKVETAWNEEEQKYNRINNYNTSMTRRIRAWASKDRIVNNSTECQWKLEGVDVEYSTAPCDAVEINPSTRLFERDIQLNRTYTLHLLVGPRGGVKEFFQREVRVEDVLVVALGDSFSSGEGNPHSFRASGEVGDPVKGARRLDTWWDRRCHRSLLSFSSLAVSVAAMQNRQSRNDALKHSFTYMNFACSGAEISGDGPHSGGLIKPYEGRETVRQVGALNRLYPATPARTSSKEMLDPQIDQLNNHLCSNDLASCADPKRPDYVIMSIGVNDVGFGDIVRELIDQCDAGRKEECATALVERRMNDLRSKFRELSRRVNQIGVKKAVLLAEYPDLTQKAGGEFCDDFSSADTLGPETTGDLDYRIDVRLSSWLINKGISEKEAKWGYLRVLRPLNILLNEVAVMPGNEKWRIISGASKRSQFRGWCARPSWFVRWIHSKEKQGMLPEHGKAVLSDRLTTGTAHPNIFGHNFLSWQIRCEFEKDGILPPGITQVGGRGSAKVCN